MSVPVETTVEAYTDNPFEKPRLLLVLDGVSGGIYRLQQKARVLRVGFVHIRFIAILTEALSCL